MNDKRSSALRSMQVDGLWRMECFEIYVGKRIMEDGVLRELCWLQRMEYFEIYVGR